MPKDSSVTQELLALEHSYWNALKAQDVDACLALTADPCVVSGPQGVSQIDKKAFAQMMQQATYTLDDFRFSDEQVLEVADDVAIVAYKVHEKMTVEGKPVTLEAAETSTWVKRGDTWQCAQHSEALLGDPFGRDRPSRR